MVPFGIRLGWFAVGLIAVIAAALVWARPGGISYLQALLGVSIIVVGAGPVVLALTGRHPMPIPIFPIASLYYAISFGLPAFFVALLWPPEPGVKPYFHSVYLDDRLSFIDVRAQALVLVGLSLMILCYYACQLRVFQKIPGISLPRDYRSRDVLALGAIMLALHLVYLFVPAMRQVPSVGQLLQPAGYLGLGILYLAYRAKWLSRTAAVIAFCLVFPAMLFKLLAGGLLTPIILVGLFFFFLMWRRAGNPAFVVAAACCVFLLAAYGPVTHFRTSMAANPQFKTYSLAEKIHHAYDRRPDIGGIAAKAANSLQMAVKRLSFLPALSVVVKKTPGEVPYWDGETYRPLLTSLVPRLIWPEKPEERVGSDFGLRYGFITRQTANGPPPPTSMNIPWIVEMYANFGAWGVLIGMSLVGVFLAFLDRLFNSPGMTPLEAVVGLTIIFRLAYPESNFSLMTGSLVPLAFALWLYFRIGLTVLPLVERRVLNRLRGH